MQVVRWDGTTKWGRWKSVLEVGGGEKGIRPEIVRDVHLNKKCASDV